jgi:hypothetical protein
MENLIIPLDRARRVVLGTRTEHFEHVPKRMSATFTRILGYLHLRVSMTYSWFTAMKISFMMNFASTKNQLDFQKLYSQYSILLLISSISYWH